MSEKIKLGFTSPHFYPATIYGGPVFSSLNTLKELANIGVDVKVITSNVNRNNRLAVQTGKWLYLPDHIQVKYYNETITDRISYPLLKNQKYDFIDRELLWTHYIFSYTVPATLRLAKRLGKPVILSPRGSLAKWILQNGLGFKMQWIKIFIKPYENLITWHATSDQEEKEIRSIFPYAKVVIIPNGISLEDFSPRERKDKTWYQRFSPGVTPERVIVSSGRLHKKKGFDILIDAFKKVGTEYPNLCLYIAGMDEGEGGNLKNMVKDLGLVGKVFFTGQLSKTDLNEFLSNADLFALPSHNENFGNVYAEALAAGIPILASKMTPWQEVEKYNCGKWVENNIENTALALSQLLNSDLEQMGGNACKYVMRFEWKNIAKQFYHTFTSLIKG